MIKICHSNCIYLIFIYLIGSLKTHKYGNFRENIGTFNAHNFLLLDKDFDQICSKILCLKTLSLNAQFAFGKGFPLK